MDKNDEGIKHPWKITIQVGFLGCPHIFHVTKPEQYTGCKHPDRWRWQDDVDVPTCRFKTCPLPKEATTWDTYHGEDEEDE